MIPHGPAMCENICCFEVPSSWVMLNLGVNVSFLDPSCSFLTHHTQVRKTFFCVRHWLHARPGCERPRTPALPLTLSRQGISWHVSYKEGSACL